MARLTVTTNTQSQTLTNKTLVDPTILGWNADGLVTVSAYDATGDGVTDDTATFQAALDAAETGGSLFVPRGRYLITSTLNVRDGTHLVGTAGAVLVAPAGFSFPVLKCDGVTVRISDLTIEKASGAAAALGANAIYIVGASDGCVIDRITANEMFDAFHVAGQEGTTAGDVTRATFDSCRANDSGQYGFRIDDSDGLTLRNCQSVTSGLDGVKLRRSARNVLVEGGYFTGATGGDGLDAYAGGSSLSIIGGRFSGNSANGIVVKTDDLTRDESADYGIVRNVVIEGVHCSDNTAGSGITIHRKNGPSGDDGTITLPVRCTVANVLCENNGTFGIYLRAGQVSVTGAQSFRNGRDGIYIDSTSLDISLIGCHVAGNGDSAANTYDGIRINGDRVQVIGGSTIGTSPDSITNDTDLSNGTKNQRYGVRIDATASGVSLIGVNSAHNATAAISDASSGAMIVGLYDGSAYPTLNLLGTSIKVQGTAAELHAGSGTPESAVTAPVGSIFLRTDGGAGTTLYVKESGAGNTGWVGK